MSSLRRSFLLFLCLPAAALSLGAQTGPPAPAPASADRTIHLDITVTAKGGALVPGLQQQDFTLLDNGAKREITSFRAVSAVEAPEEIILAIDDINTRPDTMPILRQQVLRYLRANGGKLAHPTTLALAAESGLQLQSGFSKDGNLLAGVLEKQAIPVQPARRSDSVSGEAERIQISTNIIRLISQREARLPGHKIILWVSPGWAAVSGPGLYVSTRQQHNIFDTIVTLATDLRHDRTTLYSIDPIGAGDPVSRTAYYGEFLKPISKFDQTEFGDLMLEVLVEQTGGTNLFASNDVAGLLQKAVDDASAWYEVTFNPPPAERRDEYHHLEVKLNKPGLTAHTRELYYNQP